MIAPAGHYEPTTPLPPSLWDEDERIEDPEDDYLPGEQPIPNADENRQPVLYSRHH